MPIPQLFLDSKRAKQFDGRHPWVMQHAVVDPTVPLAAGSIVDLLNTNGSWIGRGVYNPNSKIRVRLYQWQNEQALDQTWIAAQLKHAAALREHWMKQNEYLNALRLVNSEGDGLGGLVVDRFGDYFVVQINSLAMFGWRETILDWLEGYSPQAVRLVVDEKTAKLEGLEASSAWVRGSEPKDPISVSENDIRLSIDLQAGQKTGYYLDQRRNRQRAARWIPEGRLLDVCCYHGGFFLAAAKTGKIREIVAVDSSERALAVAQKNATENEINAIEYRQQDCFDALKQLKTEGQLFNSIVLDPPKMASNRRQVSSALRAYYRLNLSAVELLAKDGILVTCSCSGSVFEEDLVGVLSAASKRTRRQIQIVETLGADFDHPYDSNCPETDYLKCLICRVQ